MDDDDKPWPIPIMIYWDSEDVEPSKILMTTKSLEIEKKAEFYKLNDGVSGFYRTLYPNTYFKDLPISKMSNTNRMNLYNDQFAFISALLSDPKTALSISDNLNKETDYETLLSGISGLKYSKSVFYSNESIVDKINQRLIGIVGSRALALSIKDVPTEINDISLHSLLISSAVDAGQAEMINKFKNVDMQQVHPEYKRVYLTIQADSEEGFEAVLGLYKTSEKPSEKQQALYALGSTSIESNIDYIFSHIEFAAPQDSIYLFAGFGNNLKFRNKISDLFIRNFLRIKKHINNSGLIRHSIEYVLNKVTEEQYAKNILDFLASLSGDYEMKSAVDKTYDSLNISLKVRESYENFNF